MTLKLKFSDAPLGHEICDVDLASDLTDSLVREIDKAFDQYGVVFFRNQRLTPEQQVGFSRRLGELDRHPLARFNLTSMPDIFVVSNIVENGEPIGMADAGQYWHSDMWVSDNPPRGSILYAIEVPEENGEPLGDTLFASTAAAYEALPDNIKAKLDGRKSVFSTDHYNAYRSKPDAMLDKGGSVARAERNTLAKGDILHDVIRIHPRTGRKCIYVSEHAITRIEGLDPAESEEMIAMLEKHVIRPEFVYRHKWTVGDVVMWDNCSAIHKATSDYALPQRRLMHRTTLKEMRAA